MQVLVFFSHIHCKTWNTHIQRTPLLSGRGHLKVTFMVISMLRNLYQTDTEWFFCPHLSRSVIYVCQQTELSQKCNVLLFNFVFYRTFILVWFCEPSHDSINIDNVTVYLSHFTSCTCHCLWKSDISELSIVHDNEIVSFKSLVMYLRAVMTRTSCAVGMRNAILRNHPNT